MTRPGDITPMKVEWIELEDCEPVLADPQWVAEQKLDGVRVMARLGRGRIDFVGFGGAHVVHAASALRLPALREALLPLADPDNPFGSEWVLDGELLPHTGEYWVYDLPLGHRGQVNPETPFATRRAVLEALAPALAHPVRVTPQATTAVDKVKLLNRVMAAGAEGIMLKRIDAPYECARRVKTQLKVKLTKTVDCVVTELGRGGAKNAVLAAYEDGVLREIGACSMIGKDATVAVGDVVEVRYLYATESLTLYQPRLLHKRTDKRPEDCLVAQLTPCSKDVVTV